ncbi:MAG: glycoside hydrolase family 13 protein [Candidatus Marinimicrobia bacterium]|jgi:glycosidase|nr:glycoside hydrolase family 13 protein [Candidatus Neomarinimicrobiota bacterium]
MKNFFSICIFFLAVFISPIKSSETYHINHLEPPFWWVGMADNKLQLMVHGKNISDLEPEIFHTGIEINQVHRLSNPNYLFIDLFLSEEAMPGEFDIIFNEEGQPKTKYNYTLLKREPDSDGRQGFSPADVIYLITPDRYANGDPGNDSSSQLKEKQNRLKKNGRHGGDIQGIIDHLDYISDMGFTQIWLNPVLENDQHTYSYHGYSTTDYYNIDARFGNNELYKVLSKEAKKRGIGLVMDLILNHIGSEHWWMKDLPTIDWINNDGKFVRSNHIHESVHDPHLVESQRDLFTSGWFVETMPDLNQNYTFLANYLIQNSIWWIEYADLSGFRIDTYPYIDKNFLSIWSKRISTEYPRFNFVGEEWSSNPTMVSYWQKGSNRYDDYDSYIPSMMDFPLQEALVNGLLGSEDWNSGIVDIYRVISNDFQYGDPHNLVVFAGNHDMKRIYSQLNEQMDLYKMAMTIINTVRGIPQIYYGTEIAMSSTGDHGALRKDFPGGWPGDKVNAFTGISLNNKELEAQNFIRKLLNWRKENIAITMGNMIHYPVKNGIYVYFRSYNEALVMVIINNNKRSKRIDPNRFNEVIAEKKQGISILDNKVYDLTTKINLPGKGALILEVD